MRVRGLAVVTLMAAAVLGGCVEPEATITDPVAGEATLEPTKLAWSLSTCRVVVALIHVDAEAVAAHLPEGFTPVPGDEAFGIPPDPQADAVIGVEAFDCASGQGLNGTVENLAYGAYFTAVEPPEEHAVDGVDLPLYKWDTLVPDEARRTFLQDRGIPAVDGATDLSGLEATPTGHEFDVTVRLGDHEHRLIGQGGQPAEGFREGFYFVEYTQTPGGMASWHMPDNEAPDALEGVGVVELAPGSLPAEIVGAEVAPAFFASATTVQFVDGWVRLP